MPDNIIKKVNKIGLSEHQGREFRFPNRSGAPYEWTDSVPEDDPEFQGLLKEEALFHEGNVSRSASGMQRGKL